MFGNKTGLGILLAALLAAVVAPASAQSSATSTVGLTRTSTGSFSLDVDGADLRTVLRAIAEFSGRNIVLGQNARGVVRITRSEERRVGKSVDLGGRRIIKKKKSK